MTRLALFFAAALAMILGMDRTLGLYDEGVILTGALRAAAGDVPHAGFYANYGPGAFYPLAVLFKVFGTSAIVERGYDTAIRAGIVVFAYALIEGVATRRVALGVAAAVFFWLFGIGFYGYPLFPVTLLALAATALIQPALVGEASTPRMLAAGAAVALAALVRYDMGFVLFIGLALVLAMATSWRALAAYVAGTSVVFLGAVAVYACFASLAPFWHDIFVFSIPSYAPMRGLPFPGWREIAASPDNVAVYVTIVACAAAAWIVYSERGGLAVRSRAHWLALTFTVLATLFYLKGLVRVSPIHLMSSILASIVALGAAAPLAWRHGGVMRAAFAIVAAAAGIAALESAATALAERAGKHAMVAQRAPCATPPELHNIGCLILDRDRERAATLVAANTSPGERVFVGLGRHDKIHINDVVSYFAMDRMPATRWHHFDAGLQTSERIQREIVAELESQHVRFAIIETTWDSVAEPNGSGKSSGVRVLDAYLRGTYSAVAQFGEVYVLERKAP